jgi:hypothetical protein
MVPVEEVMMVVKPHNPRVVIEKYLLQTDPLSITVVMQNLDYTQQLVLV